MNRAVPRVLSIAGFDGSGGAGIQADLKTFSAFGCYGTTVLTALPVQNSKGVKTCYELPTQAITEQLQAIFEDGTPDAIKIGMLFNEPIIDAVTDFLADQDKAIPIVLDPVMVAKSGHALLLPDAVEMLKTKLLPLVTLITPNIPEAQALASKPISSVSDMESVANKLIQLGSKAVLLKGGHLDSHLAQDLFVNRQGQQVWLSLTKIQSNNTHGTGCTLSAAIVACLALGRPLLDSCVCAKHYLYGNLSHGAGPAHHFTF